jgi:hypothetical protein
VNALIPVLSTDWHRATRSDAMRLAVTEGLAAIDARKPQKAAPKTKRGAA